MSKLQIQTYQTEVEKIIQYGGSRKETTIRVAFQKLLENYCDSKNFILIPELDYRTKHNTTVYPDGTIKDALRLPWGYWESKDQDDNLDKEIQTKLAKGYPNDNILFEDSQTAVLIQSGTEVMRVSMADANKLDKLLTHFLNYERPEVRDFRQAIEHFKQDLPTIVKTLRQTLDIQAQKNPKFKTALDRFFSFCQQSINPNITVLDIREMIIQHILTEDIFLTIFNESQFHRENIIAIQLDSVIKLFFTGKTRRETLSSIENYYAVIRREAANIVNHHEKQKFLKVIYENFYKTYNPKAADRLGIVYTPNEIVRFMIESTDYLLDKHFNRLLADDHVEILDPATGTGTFITALIDYLPKNALRQKYLNEIHCNEVAILPYYIANLNIEYTYKQKMGKYEDFPHICFLDTLDNLGFEYRYQNQQTRFGFGEENAVRIQTQNKRKISVIIGNPPYNANQQNENDNNKNREYDKIDEAIKRTYIANSTAQKTKVYDMYARFFRWASSRLSENGILAFVTNSSFLEARTFDGFRKVVAEEFSEIYVVDLGGDVRKNPKLSGTKNNVFGIQTGVAISFMIKRERATSCKIYYVRRPEMEIADDKLEFLRTSKFQEIDFERIMPDKNHNWLNIADNDFDDLLPLANKETKLAKSQKEERAVFKLFSLGVVTARDEWVYDFSVKCLKHKVKYLIEIYNQEVKKYQSATQSELGELLDYSIKWTRAVKNDLLKGQRYRYKAQHIRDSLYRPFVKKSLYFSSDLNEMQYQLPRIFVKDTKSGEEVIAISGTSLAKPFTVLVTNQIFSYDFLEKTQSLPLYRYDKQGNRTDNITDWGLNQFRTHYQDNTITKEDIFHYTYAVLHNPAYREKYALNLKREFPRLPFYDDFYQWVMWGKQLMNLHLNYETAPKFSLKRLDNKLAANAQNQPKLKADKAKGEIQLDAITTLQGVPAEVWKYKLGNRSALEWILDQYKEKKPRDPTIAEKFNNYRFADYKEQVIELLQRVCTVSVETMGIVREMSMIKEIRIENYKSIQKLKFELGRVTVLIGENGCGKSNILEAIALSAAATCDKLDNEFLASRGIRETEPQLMRAAFDKENVTQEIKISFGENEDIYFGYALQNQNEPYAKWTNATPHLDDSILEQLASLESPSLKLQAVKKAFENFNQASKQVIHSLEQKNYLQEFLIYSPEYYCLRNFKAEGQIQPLGINGEGLFKLLQVLSLDKNKEKLDEIKEKLKLMGWFKDFQVPNHLFLGERAIQIEDRYLDQEITFDQRSTNEGFLFLLFYFCLFISENTPPFFAIDNIDASLNPKLCRRLIKELVNLAKTYNKQVIFTTHNPAILDGLNLNDDEQRLLVVSRNKSGYTRARRFVKPETPEGEEPITLSEAFLRGYLGGLPKSF